MGLVQPGLSTNEEVSIRVRFWALTLTNSALTKIN